MLKIVSSLNYEYQIDPSVEKCYSLRRKFLMGNFLWLFHLHNHLLLFLLLEKRALFPADGNVSLNTNGCHSVNCGFPNVSHKHIAEQLTRIDTVRAFECDIATKKQTNNKTATYLYDTRIISRNCSKK